MNEMEPRTAGQRLTILESLIDPDLGDDSSFHKQWLTWERRVNDQVVYVGGAMPSDIRIAVVRKKAQQNFVVIYSSARQTMQEITHACAW